MINRLVRFALIPLLLYTLHGLVAGCAKQPALTQASAPAPSGQVGATPAPPPPAPAPPSAPRVAAAPPPAPPSAPPVVVAPPSAPPVVTAAPVERPKPADFTPVPPLREVYFDFDKSTIRPDAAKTLDANAQWLNDNRDRLVIIEGHCDERGTNEYNVALGERRARATMDYLISRGVQGNRLTIISYGEERPVCTERSEACWSKNRRAVLMIKPG